MLYYKYTSDDGDVCAMTYSRRPADDPHLEEITEEEYLELIADMPEPEEPEKTQPTYGELVEALEVMGVEVNET